MDEKEVKELNEEVKKIDKMTSKNKETFLEKNVKNVVLREILEWIEVLVVAFILAMVIKTFVIETTEVSGESMMTTLHHKEKLLVNRFIYKFTTPDRGDIIVFLPDNENRNYIKRIIGLPGETIDIKEGKVFVNGVELVEDYLTQETFNIIRNPKTFPYTLAEDEYFAMGDNRGNSLDSRSEDVGVLTVDKMRGKAICRIYPFDKMCVFGDIEYSNLNEGTSSEDITMEEAN
ncbi:MAG: signal peptidase I [archaeon]|nr:signal peptidase I [archaeon]